MSGGNRRGLAAIHRILRDRPEIPHREARSAQDVREVLEDFARRGVELVAVNSGDGTIQAVMTALFSRRPFPEPPLLALLNGGTTNMTHQDLGMRGPAAGALERLIAWARHGDGSAVIRQRTVMRVDNPLHPEPLYGFFLGAACIHPAQVAPLNTYFSPSIAEVAAARERMTAFEAAQADGRASVGVDGKMVDIPVAERARRILTRAAAIQAKEARVRAAFAALGETPPRGALAYVS